MNFRGEKGGGGGGHSNPKKMLQILVPPKKKVGSEAVWKFSENSSKFESTGVPNKE